MTASIGKQGTRCNTRVLDSQDSGDNFGRDRLRYGDDDGEFGYLTGTGHIPGSAYCVGRLASSRQTFHPFMLWETIVASTTAGTTMADFCESLAGYRLYRRVFDLARLRPCHSWPVVTSQRPDG
jgi:hypothetical protein